MAYIQFSLWNVPAEVIVGNSLSMELRERWLTPAHYLYDWDTRLRWQKMTEGMSELLEIDKSDEVNTSEEKILEEPASTVESKTGSQASFDFDLSTK